MWELRHLITWSLTWGERSPLSLNLAREVITSVKDRRTLGAVHFAVNSSFTSQYLQPFPTLTFTVQQAKARPQHRELPSLLFTRRVWVLKTGPTFYLPSPKRLEHLCHLTNCRWHCKSNMFSPVILRPWLLVRSGLRTQNFRPVLSGALTTELTGRRRFYA